MTYSSVYERYQEVYKKNKYAAEIALKDGYTALQTEITNTGLENLLAIKSCPGIGERINDFYRAYNDIYTVLIKGEPSKAPEIKQPDVTTDKIEGSSVSYNILQSDGSVKKTELTIENLSEKDTDELQLDSKTYDAINAIPLEISLNVTEGTLDETSSVAISMKVPTTVKEGPGELVILHYKDGADKAPEEIIPDIHGDTLTFVTSSFSPFVLTRKLPVSEPVQVPPVSVADGVDFGEEYDSPDAESPETVISAPENVQISQPEVGQLLVTWDRVSPAENASWEVSGYRISYSQHQDMSDAKTVIAKSSENEVCLDSLPSGTYYVMVTTLGNTFYQADGEKVVTGSDLPSSGTQVMGTVLQKETAEEQHFSITKEPMEYGDIQIEPAMEDLVEGEDVKLTVLPEAGARLSKLCIKKGQETSEITSEVKDGTYSFKMPASNLTISAEFELTQKLYQISHTSDEHVILKHQSEAAEGSMVFIQTEISEGYVLESLDAKTEDGAVITTTPQEDGSYTFQMPAANVIISASSRVAETTPEEYQIHVIASENGTVTPNMNVANEGDAVTLEVAPKKGYQLTTLTMQEEGSEENKEIQANAEGVYTFEMPKNNVTISASFTKITYTITVDAEQTSFIQLDQETSGFEEMVTGKVIQIPEGQIVDQVMVTDENEKSFPAAILDDKQSFQFSMPASSVTIKVVFKEDVPSVEPIEYVITIFDTEHGSVMADCATAQEGQKVILTVTPDEGYHLEGLTLSSKEGKTPIEAVDGEYSFLMPASNVEILSTFAQDAPVQPEEPTLHPITVSPVTDGHGKVTVDRVSAKAGDTVTLTVIPDEGYELETLKIATADGTEVPLTRDAYSFIMPDSPITISAVFRLKSEPLPVPNPEPTPEPNPEPTPEPTPGPNPEETVPPVSDTPDTTPTQDTQQKDTVQKQAVKTGDNTNILLPGILMLCAGVGILILGVRKIKK